MKKKKTLPPLAEQWDFSQGMGILPEDIPFTQNIGCVGGSGKKKPSEAEKEKNNK